MRPIRLLMTGYRLCKIPAFTALVPIGIIARAPLLKINPNAIIG
jgi:hypothetical protein